MSLCPNGYREVADALDGGLDCTSARSWVSVRAPWELTNWTLPVVEALMVVGAIAALIHAVLWWRRRGDPTNLALWLASVVYVLLLEPPLYFPDTFGIQDQVGLIFVHNLFSVQFIADRMPLYILALYPALTYLMFVLVRATGVLDRTRPWVGAACVAFAFHCFYEIFDQLGPQVQWWGWNPAAPSNSPLLASVPLSSAAIFAGASPFGFALLTQLLIARRAAQGPIPWPSLAWRVVAVGALTPLFMVLFAAPYGAAGRSVPPDAALQAAALWAVIALLIVVAVWASGRRPDRSNNQHRPRRPSVPCIATPSRELRSTSWCSPRSGWRHFRTTCVPPAVVRWLEPRSAICPTFCSVRQGLSPS
jgi:hypothetical protein